MRLLALFTVTAGSLFVLSTAVVACGDSSAQPSDGTGGTGAGGSTSAGEGGCDSDACIGGGGTGATGGEPVCDQSVLAFDAECQDVADRQCCDEMLLCENTDGCRGALICKVSPIMSRCPASTEADDLLDCLNVIPSCLEDAGVCTSLVTINETCDACLSPSQRRGGCCEPFDDASDADIDALLDCLNGNGPCDRLGQAAVTCALVACGDVCPPLG